MSKLVEKIMEVQFKSYLDQSNILPVIQSGFRPGFSCTTALLHITDDIIRAADEGRITALVLLDFSKAFDTINHNLLLEILHSCGVGVEALHLFQSYLTGRSQRVRFRGKLSNSKNSTTGVPQGSILGPLLFTVYTSQFVNYITHCNIHMYADDTQLYYSFYASEYERAEELINNDLEQLTIVSEDHCLLLNPRKSAVVLFGKKSECENLTTIFTLKVNQINIEITNCAKNLGLILDRTLRFRDQTSKNIQSAYSALRLLYPHRSYLDISTKRMLCETLVLSQFSYCAPIYGPCLDLDCAAKIQRVQKTCIRFIYGIRKYERVSHKLKDLNWLTMQNRRNLSSLCLFHKIITTHRPPYLYNKISFRSDIHNINVRSKGLLTPPLHKSVFFERSFSFTIYKLYNSVPDNLKNVGENRFKKEIARYLLQRQ